LDFEDFCLQLRDKKILLVTSKMHGVVVLKHKTVRSSKNYLH
jgi:hypothetical protein